jgi:hypothetical protein
MTEFSKTGARTAGSRNRGRNQGVGGPPLTRFSELSAPRQVLVRLCQLINYGEIREIEVQNREPVFGSSTIVLVDVRLDTDEETRSEAALADFDLCQELCRLPARLDQIENGRISRIEIRAGLPRRILFESHVERLLR